MVRGDLARRRLLAQRVTGARFADPREAVSFLCAVQAQDYLGALWAVGLRTRGANETAVERAIADRSVVRTWPMRGTLHLVSAADVRWREQRAASWAGLPARSAREAVALARPRLARQLVDGRELWRSASASPRRSSSGGMHLLPPFDELLVGYRDRSAILDPAHAERVNHLLSPTIVADDRVVGTWTRSLKGDSVVVKAAFFERSGRARQEALAAAAERYAAFVGRRVVLV
jgi:hypothetical protein